MKYASALLCLTLASACAADGPVLVVETNLTLNGNEATCADLDADRIRVRFTARSEDGDGDVHRLDFACGEPMPNVAVEPGGWTVSAELSHADGIQRHALAQRWLRVGDDADDTVVPLAFDYGTFALGWSLAIDGASATCAELGSETVMVEYASHEGTRVQRLPCTDRAGTSVPMPRSKTYSLYAELTHPNQVYPAHSQTRRLVEPGSPTPVAMDFRFTAAQAGRR